MAASAVPILTLAALMVNIVEAISSELLLTTTCSVVEEVPLGSPVCSLAQLLNHNATGRFQQVNDSSARLFSVDPASGLVRTSGRIDREGIPECRRPQPVCALTLQTTWRGADNSQMLPISATIRVLDVNDNAPRFRGGAVLKASLQEHDRSASFQLPRAVDPDAGENGSVVYSLHPEAQRLAKFSLVDDPHDRLRGPVLLVVGDVNLERDPGLLRVLVLARDKGQPSLNSSFTMELAVINTNDFDPALTPKDPQRDIPENTSVNSMVLQMSASDKDEFSKPLTFSIINYDCPPLCSPFAIHPRSGEIRLTSALDAETQQRYEIYVSVTDNHPPSPRTSVSIVKVLVTDVNDNAPQIVVNRDSLTVRENSQPISTVDYISVKDRDVGNRFIHCNLDGFNRQTDAFSLTRMSGSDAVSGSGSQVLLLLQAIRSLDREQQAAHALSLTCSDSDGVASTENFTVSVGDVNDSPPVFPDRSWWPDCCRRCGRTRHPAP
ncbi:hypothetical protein BOX15_Mlig022982g3 [Macrostomum lignano]|uniref:Cadherin domain-containing protein n=1 Tax=Macrostomum lignano TaxID=282301 RepID=A0A267FYN0_9PLAT|nr:hypothetical protein BOX15_Mlig022982g3 [Macrostomum lignano]